MSYFLLNLIEIFPSEQNASTNPFVHHLCHVKITKTRTIANKNRNLYLMAYLFHFFIIHIQCVVHTEMTDAQLHMFERYIRASH